MLPRSRRGRRRSAGRRRCSAAPARTPRGSGPSPCDVAGAHRGVGDAQQELGPIVGGDRQGHLEEAGGVVVGDAPRSPPRRPAARRRRRRACRSSGTAATRCWAISATGASVDPSSRARATARWRCRRSGAAESVVDGPADQLVGEPVRPRRRTRRRCATARRHRASPAPSRRATRRPRRRAIGSNVVPMTAAVSSIRRTGSSSRSRRAATTSRTPSGLATSVSAPVTRPPAVLAPEQSAVRRGAARARRAGTRCRRSGGPARRRRHAALFRPRGRPRRRRTR